MPILLKHLLQKKGIQKVPKKNSWKCYFITEKRYPKSVSTPSRPRVETPSDVPDYLKRDSERVRREGFEPDVPSFLRERKEKVEPTSFDFDEEKREVPPVPFFGRGKKEEAGPIRDLMGHSDEEIENRSYTR